MQLPSLPGTNHVAPAQAAVPSGVPQGSAPQQQQVAPQVAAQTAAPQGGVPQGGYVAPAATQQAPQVAGGLPFSLKGGSSGSSGAQAFYKHPGQYVFRVSHIEAKSPLTGDRSTGFYVHGEVLAVEDPQHQTLQVGQDAVLMHSLGTSMDAFSNACCKTLLAVFREHFAEDPDDKFDWTEWFQHAVSPDSTAPGKCFRFSCAPATSASGASFTRYDYMGNVDPATLGQQAAY